LKDLRKTAPDIPVVI